MAESTFKVDGGIEAVGVVTGTSFKRVGGSSTEFLMADGSVDNKTYTTTDTTYDIQAQDSGIANKKHIRLSTVGGGNTDVTLVGGSNVTISRSNNELEIASSFTNTDTTYGVSATSDGSNESIILTAGGSGSGISSVSFVPGTNVTLTRSGNNITIGSTSTDSNGDVGFTGDSSDLLWDKSQSALEFKDETKAKFGDNNDLKISHTNDVSGQNDSNGDSVLDGTDWCSLIHEDGAGPLIFKSDGGPSTGAFQFYDTGWRPILKLFSGSNARTSLYHAGSEKLVTSEHGINVTGHVETDTLNVSGVTTFQNDVNFPGALYNIHWDQPTSKFKFDDNAQCVFGSATGGDLRIFHAGGHSTIKNETGQFRLAGNDVRLQSQNNSKDYIICTDGADVQLLYNDNTKLTTTDTGINVIGDIVSSAHGSVGGALTVTGDTTLTGNTIIGGNLTVNGTQTIINSNTLQIGDSQVLLNRDETGTPSQNAGIQVERGTSTNVQIRWNEGNDKWEFTNDGSTFQNIPTTNTTYGVSAQDGDVAGEKKVRLSGSNPSSTDEVVLAAGNNMTVARSGDKITFNSSYTDTDTTYSQSCVDSSNDVILRLTAGGSGSGNDDIKIKAGSNVTLTHNNSGEFTISSTDTNTTYSVGDGGLTQNNFTDTLKSKLDGIASGAEVNVQSDWNAGSGDAQILNKPTIPTNNNQLTNGAGYLTSAPTSNYQVFTSNGTWTKPASGNVAIVYMWGGGGGGANGSTYEGGGGGGSYAEFIIPMSTLSSTESVTVGGGGSPNNDGGMSQFKNDNYQAYGGERGNGSNYTNVGGYGGRGGSVWAMGGGASAGNGVDGADIPPGNGIGGSGAGGGAGGSGGHHVGGNAWLAGAGGGGNKSGTSKAGGVSKGGGNGGSGGGSDGTIPAGGGGAAGGSGARGEVRVVVV
tara:strand:- start:1593 stop:4355 length:2763 start_codon:yes stop_codon:yes gene_type:complete